MKLAQYRQEIESVESGEAVGTAESFEAILEVLKTQLLSALWSTRDAREEAAELAGRCDALIERIAPVALDRHNTVKQHEVRAFSTLTAY